MTAGGAESIESSRTPPFGSVRAPRDTLRIVQVETFYDAYMNAFYRSRPDMAAAPFAAQISALLDDGFSAAHNIAPHLSGLGYEAHFIVANCAPAQFAWLREHRLPPPPPAEAYVAILRQQIDILDPDVLYFSNASICSRALLDALKRRPKMVMGWHGAPVPPGADWSMYDVMLSGLAGMREWALRIGARATAHFMPGFPAALADAVGMVEEGDDVVFAGSWTPVQHARRNELLAFLGAAAARDGFGCAFHVPVPAAALPDTVARWRREPVFALAMQRALKGGRIVFDCRSAITAALPDGRLVDLAGDETVNMRLFEATGSGAFLLTHAQSNLARYFEPGREIETYANENELIEKVRYYLATPQARRMIAEAGHLRCRRDHNLMDRARDFDAIVRRYMPARAQAVVPAT